MAYEQRIQAAIRYFDTHWNATLDEICQIYTVKKRDLKKALMER